MRPLCVSAIRLPGVRAGGDRSACVPTASSVNAGEPRRCERTQRATATGWTCGPCRNRGARRQALGGASGFDAVGYAASVPGAAGFDHIGLEASGPHTAASVPPGSWLPGRRPRCRLKSHVPVSPGMADMSPSAATAFTSCRSRRPLWPDARAAHVRLPGGAEYPISQFSVH